MPGVRKHIELNYDTTHDDTQHNVLLRVSGFYGYAERQNVERRKFLMLC
jgi:hypothetical protein